MILLTRTALMSATLAPCVQYAEIDTQQLQIKLRHEPRSAAEKIEADYAAAARAKPGKRPVGFEVCSACGHIATYNTS